MQALDILAYNSASKPSFQNPTKNLFAQCAALETHYNLLVVLRATGLENQVALSEDREPWWTQNDNFGG